MLFAFIYLRIFCKKKKRSGREGLFEVAHSISAACVLRPPILGDSKLFVN